MDFKASADVTVLQRAPRPPRPLRAARDLELIAGCCCFKNSKGVVSLRVEADTDILYLGVSQGIQFSAWVRQPLP
jgi:hypothetical protein